MECVCVQTDIGICRVLMRVNLLNHCTENQSDDMLNYSDREQMDRTAMTYSEV